MKRLDHICPYPTPKVARIKDCRLGLLRLFFILAIYSYVIIELILNQGKHLQTLALDGVHEAQLDHPTRGHCNPMNVECMQNFTSMSKLPYCQQSPEPWPLKLPCQYLDGAQLRQPTTEGVLVPTHIAKFTQVNGCKPGPLNNWTCVGWLYDFVDKSGERQLKRGGATPSSEVFVADIERYTLLIDHSVHAKLGFRHYAPEMVGFWDDCSKGIDDCHLRLIKCNHPHCPSIGDESLLEGSLHATFRGDRRSLTLLASLPSSSTKRIDARRRGQKDAMMPVFEEKRPEIDVTESSAQVYTSIEGDAVFSPDEDFDDSSALQVRTRVHRDDSVVMRAQQVPRTAKNRATNVDLEVEPASISGGDIFSIGTLLKAANLSLDARRHDVPAWMGGTYRSSGFVLVIRIHYSNLEPWLGIKTTPWRTMGPSVHYTIQVTKHASDDDFMLRKVFQNHGPRHARIVKEFHGIRILVEQSGTVVVWNNIQLLVVLTTTLALTTVAAFITDTIALKCMPQSEHYHSIKHERPRTKSKRDLFDKTSASDGEHGAG